MKYNTIKEAAQAWVAEFNSYPESMIKTLMKANPGSWSEITKPSCGDRVYVYDHGTGEITDIKVKNNKNFFVVLLDSDKKITIDENNLDLIDNDGPLPMWGTLWSFGNQLDNDWLEKEENQYKMSACGFRIYHHTDWGFFFGIDGAGYDFYEAHWIPLYKARGLYWHKKG